jgi:hypothetical protein
MCDPTQLLPVFIDTIKITVVWCSWCGARIALSSLRLPWCAIPGGSPAYPGVTELLMGLTSLRREPARRNSRLR